MHPRSFRAIYPNKNKARLANKQLSKLLVEQLEARIVLGVARDFGDAPDSYSTLLPNGPRHDLGSALFLGTTIDGESDGQPSTFADQDDLTGSDTAPEDGVTIPILVPGQSAIITVVASMGGGLLDAFIDFDGNGVFDLPGERVADSVPMSAGTNSLPIAVPSNATGGVTIGRFRISTDTTLSFDGAADDGEVEDHSIDISGPALELEVTKDDELIDLDGSGGPTSGDRIRYTVVLTATGDRHTDVVFSDFESDHPGLTLVVGSVTSTRGTIPFGNDPGDTPVIVEVGNLNEGQTATIRFELSVDSPAPAAFCNQGSGDSNEDFDTPSDDPDTPALGDETCTPLGNLPPVAGDDSDMTPEDTPKTVTVLGNDTDPDGGTLSVAAVADPANGSAVINANSTITYSPDLNFNGVDTFTYTIGDGQGGSDTATVTVTVTPLPDPPDAVNDSISTPPNTPVIIKVLINDSDPDFDPLTIINISNATVVNNGNGTVSYSPVTGFEGVDTFQYTIDDGTGRMDTATVTVTVGGCEAVLGVNRGERFDGVVEVKESRGRVSIRGDAGNNSITIRSSGEGGSIVVEGNDGTEVTGGNGQRGRFVLVGAAALEKTLNIFLAGGDDRLFLDGALVNLLLPGNLKIRQGTGNDVAILDPLTVEGRTQIDTGRGDDVVTLIDVLLQGGLRVRTQRDNDEFALCNAEVPGRVRTRTGQGSDMVILDDGTYGNRVQVQTGGQNDAVQVELIPGGTPTEFQNRVRVNTAGGDDDIAIGLPTPAGNSAHVRGCSRFRGGRGADTLDAGLGKGKGNNHGNVFDCVPRVTGIEDQIS